MRKLLINVNFKRLQQNLSLVPRRPWTEEAVREWLVRKGFVPTDEGWQSDEILAGNLQPTEYSIIRELP